MVRGRCAREHERARIEELIASCHLETIIRGEGRVDRSRNATNGVIIEDEIGEAGGAGRVGADGAAVAVGGLQADYEGQGDGGGDCAGFFAVEVDVEVEVAGGGGEDGMKRGEEEECV